MSNVKTNGKLYHTESEERNSISVCKRSCNEAKEKVQIHDRSWKNMELLESPKAGMIQTLVELFFPRNTFSEMQHLYNYTIC